MTYQNTVQQSIPYIIQSF